MTARRSNVFRLFPVLEDCLNQRAGTLRGGECHKLSVGMSLMIKPGLILIDEPSTGLAPPFGDLVEKRIFVKCQLLSTYQHPDHTPAVQAATPHTSSYQEEVS
jgi:ABC-type branched-subunit amino acid transport system ATPase component